MDKILAWRVRLIGSFVIALLLVAAYFLLTGRNPETKIKLQVSAAETVHVALEQTASSLKELPGPAVITPQLVGSADKYTSQFQTAAPIFNVDTPPTLQTIRNFPPHKHISAYNSIISDAGFTRTYGESRTLLASVKALLAYHTAVMTAFQNLLEYPPAEDTNRTDKEQLLQAVRITGGGLEKANARLDALPDYTDETMASLRIQLTELETVRKEYEAAIESGQDEDRARARYIDAFSSVQRVILSDRQEFWSVRSESALLGIENARREFTPYLTRLTNL